MADESAEPLECFVCILHNPDGELSVTVGRITIGPTAEAKTVAEKRIEFWLARQRRKHNCRRYGDRCAVNVRPSTPGLKSLELYSMSEPIVPAEAPPAGK